MKYLKWVLISLTVLGIGFLIAIKPGLFVGIAAVLVITAIVVFLAIWLMRRKGEEKPEKKGGWKRKVVALGVLLVAAIVTYNYFKPKPVAVVQYQMPVCAGNYDFSRVELPASGKKVTKVTVNFQPDCVCEVTLPPCANYRTRSTAKHLIRFVDGSEYVDWPGKQTWFGVHKGIFKVQGIREAGTLEIYLEKT